MAHPHPLHLDLVAQARGLHDELGRSILTKVQSGAELLDELATFLAAPQYTLLIAKYYRPLLVDLTARWLDDDRIPEEARFVAFGLLLQTHEEIFPALLEFLQRPSLKSGPLAFVTSENSASLLAVTLQPILLAYARILHSSPFLPEELGWPLHPLLYILLGHHPHRGVVYLAIQCYWLQSHMTEQARDDMVRKYLGELGKDDCVLDYAVSPAGDLVQIDGWVLNVHEFNRISDDRNAITSSGFTFAPEPTLLLEHLCSRVVNVERILLLKDVAAACPVPSLVMTTNLVNALEMLAAQYSLRLPTLLTAASSAGKTLLLNHLASRVHPTTTTQTIPIHLADTSIDARSLLGSHVSSQTEPGKFEWKEGVLLRAMREGRWVVLKDIDRASIEVLSVLLPLIDSMTVGKYIGSKAYIDVPNRGRVYAHPAFAIFATRSVAAAGSTVPPVTFLGAHKFTEIVVQPPSLDDLRQIVDAKFTRLAGQPAGAVIQLWETISQLGPAAGVRPVGMRELDKFCSRVASLLPANWAPMDVDASTLRLADLFAHPSLREDVFLEARDVFFGTGAVTVSAQARNAEVAKLVADSLELTLERAKWLLDAFTPQMNAERNAHGQTTALRIGRTRLLARAPPSVSPTSSGPFAMHRPALTVMARVAAAVALTEPVLLTGETGTGKTTMVAHIASQLGRRLVALNLSNQSEAADLVGGFKPVDARFPGSDLQDAFGGLFERTFSRRKNEKFEEAVGKAVRDGKWKRAVGLWHEAIKLAKDRFAARPDVDELSSKRRKLNDQPQATLSEWEQFERDVSAFNVQHVLGKSKLAFAFVEGPLLKALRSGDWILLDEINLATPETLECISALLQGPEASITLTEHGSLEPVPRHPDFRLFACMNPATDVGKKDLPPNIRGRFTEIFVPPPDADPETLDSIVRLHIGALAVGDNGAIRDVAEFYTAAKRLADARELADGSNQRPHFSMRTLTRMLAFVTQAAPSFGLRRALWEGGLMAFMTSLDDKSVQTMRRLAEQHLLARVKNINSTLSLEPSAPTHRSRDDFIKVGPYWLERGPHEVQVVEEYIVTPSVAKKLVDLARVVYAKRFPVLIEGPTSSGKTSTIEYLARRTGHRFVRINNHEHTDIQEYIGSYVTDPDTGKLSFQDGILVRALRHGDWIVLDELNLAPTDVLEALNRLLDDNRELLIPETQEVVKPHEHFRLFATQNPPGLYAGRKVLSRAFRNRFLELFFDDVPENELEDILSRRTRIAPPYATRIVAVFHELQKRRQTSRIFETKHGFATLRDLFRWAGRDAASYLELAQNGYMLLAERARRPDDKVVVKEVLESIMKVKIDETVLYGLTSAAASDLSARLGGVSLPTSSERVVWSNAMQRLFVLVASALRYNEPVLLVGETGCGKTSVCEIFAETTTRALHTISCHQNTETADIIGGQRPIQNRAATIAAAATNGLEVLQAHGIHLPAGSDPDALVAALDRLVPVPGDAQDQVRSARQELLRAKALFNWHDGPLIEAMRSGGVMLLDEISLADDSVLERLNSVLEPERTIVLAEMGGRSLDEARVTANGRFKLLATMNPGGDYGKKELSPALRNRFTEIWVPPVDDRSDRELIVSKLWQHASLQACTKPLLDFVEWLAQRSGDASTLGLRDLLAWVRFSNYLYARSSPALSIVFHNAARLCLLDGLDSTPMTAGFSQHAVQQLREAIDHKLQELVPLVDGPAEDLTIQEDGTVLKIGTFAVSKRATISIQPAFDFGAPTTLSNAMRVLRALQVPKPILLEGSPGVGKTSLVVALAARTGNNLERINLSDQTDMVDLLGSDLPVEGGKPGEFAWKDAAFLRALQDGHWVLLDEMNLAPQAVLEGLNAVLDHRGEVFIPEMGRSFNCHPNFRVFAAQNPQHQGGGRKGLPKSFLNRFTKVYLQELDKRDLFSICQRLHPELDDSMLHGVINYSERLHAATMVTRSFGRSGSPWEFNLRDILRWTQLTSSRTFTGDTGSPADSLNALYLRRFRSEADRFSAAQLFATTTDAAMPSQANPWPTHSPGILQVGPALLPIPASRRAARRPVALLQGQLSSLSAIASSISHSTLMIFVGADATGKTCLARLLAQESGVRLHEHSLHGSVDTMDILGSFEQSDRLLRLRRILTNVVDHMTLVCQMQPEHLTVIDAELLSRLWSKWTDTDAPAIALRCIEQLTDLLPPELVIRLQEVYAGAVAPLSGPTFEWYDGTLVQALQQGDWVFLDNANLCNASVVDRLNSLCEIDGSLTLSERGLVNGSPVILKPHPSFRLILGVNPRHGELSRAMRNRGLEVCLDSITATEDVCQLHGIARLPSSTGTASGIAQHAARFELSRRGLLQESSSPRRNAWMADSVTSRSAILNDVLPLKGTISAPKILSHVLTMLGQASQSSWRVQLRAIRVTVEQEPTATVELLLLDDLKDSSSIFSRWIESCFSMMVAMRGVPLHFLQAQPVVFSTNPVVGSILPDVEPELALELYSRSHSFALDVFTSANLPPEQDLEQKFRNVAGAVCFFLEAFWSATVAHWTPQPKFGRVLQLFELCITGLQLFRAEVLDISAIRVLALEIDELVQRDALFFEPVVASVRELTSAVSLSRGDCINEVWKLGLRSSRVSFSTGIIGHLERRFTHGDQTRRRVTLELLASFGLPAVPITHELATKLSSNREDPLAELPDALALAVDLVVLELNFLATSSSTSGFGQMGSSIILDLMTRLPTRSALSCVPMQLRHWLAEVTLSTELTPDLIYWHSGCFLEESWRVCPAEGPSMLLRPILTQKTLELSAIRGHPISQLVQFEERLKFHGGVVAALSLNAHDGRCGHLLAIALDTLRSLHFACASQPDAVILPAILNTLAEWKAQAVQEHWSSSSLRQYCQQAAHLRHGSFRDAVALYFGPLLSIEVNTMPSFIAAVGRLFLATSLLSINIYMPNIPVDPVAETVARISTLNERLVWLQSMLDAALAVEGTTTGNSTSPHIQRLQQRVVDIGRQRQQIPDLPFQRESSPRLLSRLHGEIQTFIAQVANADKLKALTEDLIRGQLTAQARVQSTLATLVAFKHRLSTSYPTYADLVAPFNAAVTQLATGISMMAHSSPSLYSHQDGLVHCVSRRPSIGAAIAVRSQPSRLESTAQVDLLVLAFAGLAFERSSGVDTRELVAQVDIYAEQLCSVWLLDRELEVQREKAETSLYRQAHEDQQADEEERDFLALFPQFTAEGGQPAVSNAPAAIASKALLRIREEHVELVIDAHLQLWATASPTPRTQFPQLAINAVKAKLNASVASDDSLDSVAWSAQLSELRNTMDSLASQDQQVYNFYRDPNVPEIRKALTVLQRLEARLQHLVTLWPDQMVLFDIASRCRNVLALDVHSPVAQVLSSLEGLLLHCADWERYANRENSLHAEQQLLTSLIVDWRRLELTFWSRLLDIEVSTCEAGVAEWWFHMYDMTIRGTLASEEVNEYLASVVPLLESFITSGPIGQFNARIQLIGSFARFLKVLAVIKDTTTASTLGRVSHLLTLTCDYYTRFSSSVGTTITNTRTKLEREISDFIKLASWKDINVEALRQSAQKTHRQLHKCIRKFRQCLRQSFSVISSTQLSKLSLDMNISPPPYVVITVPITVPEVSTGSSSSHLINLQSTLQRLNELLRRSISPGLRRQCFQPVNDMVTEIRDVVTELSKARIDTADRRATKSLLQRKQRSWSDMLKQLRRAGMPIRVKPDALQNQHSRVWLLSQLTFPLGTLLPNADQLMPSIDSFYLSLVEGMSKLRSGLAGHHSDIPTRELERAISVTEASFQLGIDGRTRICEAAHKLASLSCAVERLRAVNNLQIVVAAGAGTLQVARSLHIAFCRTVEALQELQRAFEDFDHCRLEQPPMEDDVRRIAHEQLDIARQNRDSLSTVVQQCGTTSIPILLADEHVLLTRARSTLEEAARALRATTISHPRCRLLYGPVAEFIDSTLREIPQLHAGPTVQADNQAETAESLINTILVVFQELQAAVAHAPRRVTDDEPEDNFVSTNNRFVQSVGRALHVQSVLERLNATLLSLATGNGVHSSALVQRFLPFLEHLLVAVQDHFLEDALWTHALFKLTNVLCSTVTTISANGWCQPQEEDKNAKDDESSGQQLEGTGLGSGTGEKNVSNEIEDEAQVEGLQDEMEDDDQNQDCQESGDQDNTIEMSEDFGGRMEDAPDKDGEEDDGEEEEGEDVDDRVEDLDPTDPNAVDEKMWGDDSGPEPKDGDDRTQKDSAPQNDETELGAKEAKQDSQAKDKPKEPHQDKDSGEGDNEPEEIKDEAQQVEEDQPDQEPVGAGGKVDDYTQEGDALELPDDLNLGEDDPDGGEDDGMSLDDEQVDGPDDDHREGSPAPEDDSPFDESAEATREDTGANDLEIKPEEIAAAQPDVSAGNDTDDVATEAAGTGGSSRVQRAEQHNLDQDLEHSDVDMETHDEETKTASAQNGQPPEAPPGTEQSQGEQGSSTVPADDAAASSVAPLPNPLRHLGDAMKEIQRRLNEILEPAESSRETATDQNAKDVEYQQGVDDSMDMQALGPAQDAEKAKLDELKFSDFQESQPHQANDINMMEIDKSPAPIPISRPQTFPHVREETEEDRAQAILSDGTRESKDGGDRDVPALPAPDKIDADDLQQQSRDVEDALRRWQSDEQHSSDSEQLWRQYEGITHHLSYALCEQLRLILEPTRASRLRGDYRTGKRLNMKKIIPFIASEYTKDKIWLRRTRPSDREYQVLLALDDSRSMAESHSVHLAFQTLALVGRALTRLEAGDVGVARFGQSVDLLHGFDAGPFTEQAGSRVIRNFTFDQTATNVLGLMDASLRILGEARERRAMQSSTSADLWQLEIIISDGMCQSHDELRVLLRRALEQRIMVVFIVIDALRSSSVSGRQNSILTMNQVVEKGGGDFEMRRYLDSFPFEYYVVLRDVEALPEVLSNTLRQFFERVTQE
ncbi:P-loop containing nucleoside triphosphate hydrolase protein [Auriculariales sp. MPI-PUGE-AT-0066]|nr:P-loop containing nucleoside triphosphate hydrolase protein [Auriculariales sp. MPI-PUGE-AT-0066]